MVQILLASCLILMAASVVQLIQIGPHSNAPTWQSPFRWEWQCVAFLTGWDVAFAAAIGFSITIGLLLFVSIGLVLLPLAVALLLYAVVQARVSGEPFAFSDAGMFTLFATSSPLVWFYLYIFALLVF